MNTGFFEPEWVSEKPVFCWVAAGFVFGYLAGRWFGLSEYRRFPGYMGNLRFRNACDQYVYIWVIGFLCPWRHPNHGTLERTMSRCVIFCHGLLRKIHFDADFCLYACGWHHRCA